MASDVDALLMHSPAGWLAVRWPEGVVLTANRKSEELCGRTSEQIVGRPWWELLEPESAQRLGDWIAQWRRGELPGPRSGMWLHRTDETETPITLRAVILEEPVATGEATAQHFLILEDRRETQALAERFDNAEARLEETQRVAQLGWWEWDIQNNRIAWSDALYEVMGIPSGEFGGTLEAFLQGVHPDDHTAMRERLGATLKRGEQFVHEFRTIANDGTIRYLRSQAKLSRDEFGWPIRLYGFSARTLALQELTRSEQKYRDLVETSNEMIWSVDLQGRLTFVNQSVREFYGYEPDELLGQVFTVLLPPELLETDWKVFEAVLAGQRLFDYETVHLRKDGRRIDLSFNAITMYDAEGRLIGATGTAINITERKRQQELLRERESWFRAIFENAPQCLMILSPDGKLLDINPTGREILEATASDQLLGHLVSDWLAPASRSQFLKAVEAVRDGAARSWQAQIQGETDSRGWLEGQMVPLRDANGQIIRLLAAAQDVTARRKADSLREGEQQVLEEIASGHDLPSVLRTVIKMLEMQLPGALCSILLLNEEGQRLTVEAASPMPEEIRLRLSQVPVVPGSPSFADSVASGRRRIVDDTMTAPSWTELRGLVDRFQLRSCWSQPIRGFNRDVLGGLSIFFLWPRSPNASDLQLLDTAAYLTGIAIHRMRAAQELRDSEQRFRTLFEHSPDAIFVESLTGLVLDVNPAACELHGLTREQLIGKHVMELVPPRYRDDVRRDFPKLISGELRQLEGFSWHVERGEVPISLHGSKTEYASQPALLFHVRDITERKRAEDKAREVEAQLAHVGRLSLMGELMAGISHEINQPLFAIANFAKACPGRQAVGMDSQDRSASDSRRRDHPPHARLQPQVDAASFDRRCRRHDLRSDRTGRLGNQVTAHRLEVRPSATALAGARRPHSDRTNAGQPAPQRLPRDGRKRHQ
ncbi:MAG: multi-sensor signal transduction histidine kinase [Planctomycetota bacterium]|nr:MAG: multi-sensor signal transduction histidine kinase [Planctomycetota bacterium]